jgi:hypothetical protein
MCLQRIDKQVVKNVEKTLYGECMGYKVVLVKNKTIHPLYTGKRLKTGKWIKEEDFATDPRKILYSSSSFKGYRRGFHFFITPSEAYNFVSRRTDRRIEIRKIYFKKPTAFGYQEGRKVGVAKEIFICKGKY